MGEIADPTVFQLVTDLCASFPTFKEEAQEDEASFEMAKEMEMEVDLDFDSSISYDKVLAELFDMGYEIELATKAISDCGRLDVAAIIEHMNSEVSTTEPADLAIMPSTSRSTAKVKVEHDDEQVSSSRVGQICGRTGPFEASTSKIHPSIEDDDGGDSDRWEHDDPDADKESQLLRMDFRPQDVTAAIEACGIASDVNELANHIINNYEDPAESNWDDYGPVDDDMVDPKSVRKGDYEDLDRKKLSDQGLSVLKKVQIMGFSFTAKMVAEAIQSCGKDAEEDALVEYLLSTDESVTRDGNNDEALHLTKLEQLKRLGCTSTAACMRAIDNNGDADIYELLDYYYAEELQYEENDEDTCNRDSVTQSKKRKKKEIGISTKLLQKKSKKVEEDDDDDKEEEEEYCRRFYRNMKGFGLPGEPVIPRVLSEDISRPPYFYFENVALTPKDEWNNIQRHLYNIAPEFVDSLNFSPCRRPRGYIHNLPVEGRVEILRKPPMSVQELIPGSNTYWPAWDSRVKLNTINTRSASDFVRRQIRESMIAMEKGALSCQDIKSIMFWAKKWNLVWVRPGVLAPLSPEEIETCLGFDIHHTRVLYSPVDRVRVLGNSFQVNTVAYHLSVLRPMYSSGIRVLSLFSGIGGAEVALHKLGIFLKLVVSVEIDDKSRMVVDSWWKTTNQKGRLIHSFKDVKEVDSKAIQGLVDEYGGFDLVIGGSPCNNLSGNNRCTRTGLAGPASVTFFEFPRILSDVRDFMSKRR